MGAGCHHGDTKRQRKWVILLQPQWHVSTPMFTAHDLEICQAFLEQGFREDFPLGGAPGPNIRDKALFIMRLMNVKSMKLEDFTLKQTPKYAILSHTWEDEEVTYQDLLGDRATARKGYTKILRTCQLASKQGLHYAWVDTCCIDKTSSAELSEAINSMYRWYKESEICYAFIADLKVSAQPEGLLSCRWWTRGWTLQELIAPSIVEFFDCEWNPRGSRNDNADMIASFTKIHTRVLMDSMALEKFSVAQRMSWAASRQTTRPEDQAYSLLGIFGVNISLIYGEGKNAFRRLLEAIINKTDDLTVLACEGNELLAVGPDAYAGQHDLKRGTFLECDFSLTNKGLKFTGTCPLSIRDYSIRSREIVLTVAFRQGGYTLPLVQVAPLIFARCAKGRNEKINETQHPVRRHLPLSSFTILFSPDHHHRPYLRLISTEFTPLAVVIDAMPLTHWEWETSFFFSFKGGINFDAGRHGDLVLALRARVQVATDLYADVGLFIDMRVSPQVYILDSHELELDAVFGFDNGKRRENSISWYELERQFPQIRTRRPLMQMVECEGQVISVKVSRTVESNHPKVHYATSRFTLSLSTSAKVSGSRSDTPRNLHSTQT